jgi:hypothetical protein
MSDERPTGPPNQPADQQTEPEEQPRPDEPARNTDYEDPVNESSADSFPASDPPSFTDSAATRNPGR